MFYFKQYGRWIAFLCALFFVPVLAIPASATDNSQTDLDTILSRDIDADRPAEAPTKDAQIAPLANGRLVISNNDFSCNSAYGLNSSFAVIAWQNWWGDDDGPTHASNPQGQGDAVTDQVNFEYWLWSPQDIGIVYEPHEPCLPPRPGILSLTLNNFEDNGSYGLYSTMPVTAEHSWWGDPTGPYHASLNPGGLGEQVSDDVGFAPWLSDRLDPLPQIEPASLDFGTTFNLLKLYITPDRTSDMWSMTESIPWLDLSKTSGRGPATVWATVDRSGLPNGHYSGILHATVAGQTGTHAATLAVSGTSVEILLPPTGANVRVSDDFLVRATVTSGGQGVPGAEVMATIPLSGPWAVTGSLFDDGQHDDGGRDDEVYAALIPLPDRLTMPPGAYTLIVTATVNGVPGSASVGIDVVGGFQGAPTVDVDLGRPKGASYVRGEDLAITATVQFPDLSTHNDSLVVATVYLPDGTRSQAGLNNIGDNSWQGTFALSQSGHYELWVRVDPPADTGFVDGNGWERFDVLGGDLAVDPAPYPDPYPLYGKVPLTACVTYQGIPLDGALVGCEVRAPNGAVTAKGPLETYKRGCYESTFTPVASGQHVVTYTVEAFPYPPISVVRTFEVSEERSDIAFEVYYFGDDALDLADEIMQRVEQAAEAGEYYAEQRHADAVEAVADLSVGVLFLPLDLFGGSNAYLYVQDYVPGIGMIPFNLPLEALQTFAAGFVEGASAGVIKASAANLRQSPGVFYATSGNATEMWAMFGDREEVEAFIEDAFAAGETDVFSNRFVVVLQPVVDNAKDDIETQATSLALAPPPMTLPQEEAYIHDLSMRSEANRWLGPQALEYRSSFLLESYAWRQNPLVGDLAKLAEFLAWNGAKIYAAALCDGPCALMVGLFKLQEDYVANIERVNNDEQMMRLGLDLMDNGYWSERLVWANTLSALETIKQTQPPNTPQGEITEIDFRRGIREFQMGYFVWEYSMAYADITISNSGGVTADFYPVLYGHHGPGLVNWADNLIIADQFRDPSGGGDWLHSVTLEPGEERTVRLILLEDRSNSYYDDPIGINDEPRERSTTFVKLFAQTDQGVYLVESKDEKYNPQAESAKLLGVGSQLNVHYLSKPRQDWSIDSDEPQWTLPFPLQVDVGSSKDSLDYSVSILATNPFPQPMTVVISQAVPADVDLLQIRKGAASDGEIRWYKIIQPGESEVMGYDFRPAAHTLDTEIALPPVNMSFYSAAEDAIIRLSTGPRSLAIKPALYGQGTAPQHVQPGGALTARVEVTNRDVSQAHQGDLWFSLLDLNDRQVVSTALPLEVPAGNSQIYSVTLTAPITSSTYVLKGVLSHEVSTSTVLHAFVHVWEPDFSSSSPDWLGQMTVFTSTAASPIPADPLETFHWSFGDGVTSTLEHPTHVYSEPGTYTVTLMAGNAIAQQAVTDTVTVFSSPSASFESSSPDLVGQTTTFTNTTVTIPEGDPSLHYAWSFGDGITSTMEHPSHAYPSPAAYTVTLSATNVISFSTVTQVVSITDAAVAGLAVESSSPTPLGQTTYFTAWVTAGTTMLYGWNFGDGMVGQGASVSHTYPAVDVYNAVVTASNSVSLLTATTAVTITEPGFYIYLPLVLKNQ